MAILIHKLMGFFSQEGGYKAYCSCGQVFSGGIASVLSTDIKNHIYHGNAEQGDN